MTNTRLPTRVPWLRIPLHDEADLETKPVLRQAKLTGKEKTQNTCRDTFGSPRRRVDAARRLGQTSRPEETSQQQQQQQQETQQKTQSTAVYACPPKN